MQLKPVESSNIAEVGYDPVSQTLEVRFKQSGKLYRYSAVSAETMAGFEKAPSKGSFFARNIRTCHECVPVDEAPKQP